VVPASRIRTLNQAPVRPDGDFVLYWITTTRRVHSSFALERAVWWANELNLPLVVLEALRTDYPWASERLHRFVLDGMADQLSAFDRPGVSYLPYVERERGGGRGLLAALGARAAVVVGDDYPVFFLPQMLAAAARQLPVRFELVDSRGLLPMRASERVFARAYDFRRFVQRWLPDHLAERPQNDPLAALVARPVPDLSAITARWPMATAQELQPEHPLLAGLPIDHEVGPVAERGGARQADRVLQRFVAERLVRYQERNHPDVEAASGLSPWLHFGQLGAQQVFDAVARAEGWSPQRLGSERRGAKSGFWQMSEAAEGFLDELITWRELGANFAVHRDDYDRLDSLPDWAQHTLGAHAADPRPVIYPLDTLAAAKTHAPLWNAAQRELLHTGRMQNYLRMVWGKKVLQWSPSPEEALAVLIELNDRYALDGRDPNSYAGMLWVFGRYDRAWGPERPIFGKLRYMSLKNTQRKLKLTRYLARWSATRVARNNQVLHAGDGC
jgi:deoxyribodipyrimidine photo-lyase